MPTITYITAAGDRVPVEAQDGTLMTAAVDADVEGIEGACGGVCSCATCHVHVDPAWTEKVGPPSDAELDLLEFEDRFDATRSRLGCQVNVTPELDGLVVTVATGQ